MIFYIFKLILGLSFLEVTFFKKDYFFNVHEVTIIKGSTP